MRKRYIFSLCVLAVSLISAVVIVMSSPANLSGVKISEPPIKPIKLPGNRDSVAKVDQKITNAGYTVFIREIKIYPARMEIIYQLLDDKGKLVDGEIPVGTQPVAFLRNAKNGIVSKLVTVPEESRRGRLMLIPTADVSGNVRLHFNIQQLQLKDKTIKGAWHHPMQLLINGTWAKTQQIPINKTFSVGGGQVKMHDVLTSANQTNMRYSLIRPKGEADEIRNRASKFVQPEKDFHQVRMGRMDTQLCYEVEGSPVIKHPEDEYPCHRGSAEFLGAFTKADFQRFFHEQTVYEQLDKRSKLPGKLKVHALRKAEIIPANFTAIVTPTSKPQTIEYKGNRITIQSMRYQPKQQTAKLKFTMKVAKRYTEHLTFRASDETGRVYFCNLSTGNKGKNGVVAGEIKVEKVTSPPKQLRVHFDGIERYYPIAQEIQLKSNQK